MTPAVPPRDLRACSAIDFLNWCARIEVGEVDVRQVRHFVMAGIFDLDTIASVLGTPAARGVALLTDAGALPVTPPLTAHDLTLLPLVGVEVYRHDRDNVEDWASAARRYETVRSGFSAYEPRRAQPRSIITAFLQAGRGPNYARQIIEIAARCDVDPTAFGFELSVGEWEALAASGITGQSQLDGYYRAGCDLATAVRLAAEGVPAGVAVVAAARGVAREEWARWAGIPPCWVPLGPEDRSERGSRAYDPVKDGPLGKGHGLDDLKAYADAGWSVSLSDWRSGKWIGRGRRGDRVELSRGLCARMLEAGLTPDDLPRWAEALTQSSSGSRQDVGYVASLSGRHRWSEELIDLVVALHQVGVRPSHINDYRYCGCSSTQDVLTAVAAGIDGKRVAHLRRAYGASGRWGRSPRLTLRQLLEHHTRDTAAAAPVQTQP